MSPLWQWMYHPDAGCERAVWVLWPLGALTGVLTAFVLSPWPAELCALILLPGGVVGLTVAVVGRVFADRETRRAH